MPTPTLRDVHIEAPLSNVSIAFRNESYIGEQLFPNVKVQKKTDLYWIFEKSAWFRNEVGTRAPGTRAPRADYSISTGSYVCLVYALAKAIPDEVRENVDAPLRPDVETTEFLTDSLLRALEVRIANKTTGGSSLWANAASPSIQWSDPNSDPLGDLENAINNVTAAIGRAPNKMAMSWDVWRYLKNHPDLLDRIRYTRSNGRVEPGDLAAWTDIPSVLIGRSIYDKASEGQSASMAYIWGDGVWLGYVTNAPALLQPTAGYTVEWQARQVKRFREDQEYQDVVEVSHSTAELITASDAGTVLYNCI